MKENMLRAISNNGGIIFCGVDSTEIVRKAEQLHKTSAVTTAALGRLLTAASMMGMMQKNTEDTVTIRVNGGGPAGMLIAVGKGDGSVKGYLENPIVELPLRPDGHLNVGGAVGKDGLLSVVRDLGFREPTIGQVPLVSGEIAEDITSYYAQSEQIPTACALGVLVNPDLTVACAGGYLVQLLPGATEQEITQLEQNIAKMESVTNLLARHCTVEQIMEQVMEGFEPEILDQAEAVYKCDCSMERTKRILKSLGKEELLRMSEEEENITAECEFCDKTYNIHLPTFIQETF